MSFSNTSEVTDIIDTHLKAKFPSLTWLSYPTDMDLNKAKLPLAFLELSNIEHKKTHSDLFEAELNYSLKILYSDDRKDKLRIRNTALAIGCYLDDNWYEQTMIHSSNVITSQPDYFSPEVAGFEAWEVNFIVKCTFGDTIYELNDVSPDVDIEIIE